MPEKFKEWFTYDEEVFLLLARICTYVQAGTPLEGKGDYNCKLLPGSGEGSLLEETWRRGAP